MTRRTVLLATTLLSAALLTACSTSSDNPNVASSGTPATQGSATQSSPAAGGGGAAAGGTDAIGGSVSGDLKAKPVVKVPGGARPTKLLTKDVVKGSGPVAGPSATVNVQYLGVNYADGQEFDSSWAHGGQPVSFPLSQVIPGFAQGIVGMHVGGRREIVIPASLGYGPQGSGPVKPDEDLIFVVDLVGVQQ